MRQAAALLARAGFDVAVPTIPGLTRGRLRPDDVEPVVATLAARAAPTVIVSVSVGAGPALLAAAEPAVRERVRVVLSLGGYASATELLRFFLTGDFRWGDHPRPRRARPCDRGPVRRGQRRPARPSRARRPHRSRAAVARPRSPPAADGAGLWTSCRPSGSRARFGPAWCSSTAHAIVPCPTPRACAWRPSGPSGLASSWWASWTTWRPPGARRGCRVCGSWEGCSSRCTASPGRPDRGFCAGDSRPRSPSAADVSSPVPSQTRLVSI